jgi:hypothetical protein
MLVKCSENKERRDLLMNIQKQSIWIEFRNLELHFLWCISRVTSFNVIDFLSRTVEAIWKIFYSSRHHFTVEICIFLNLQRMTSFVSFFAQLHNTDFMNNFLGIGNYIKDQANNDFHVHAYGIQIWNFQNDPIKSSHEMSKCLSIIVNLARLFFQNSFKCLEKHWRWQAQIIAFFSTPRRRCVCIWNFHFPRDIHFKSFS